MSQSKHRQQLRRQQEKTHTNNFDAFRPLTAVVVHPPLSPRERVTAAVPVLNLVDYVSPPAAGYAEPAASPVEPAATRAIVPTAVNGVQQTDLQAHGKRTAEFLSQLPTEEYQAALASLETENPTLYGIVADELNNIASQVADTESGDGFNLSTITSPPPIEAAG